MNKCEYNANQVAEDIIGGINSYFGLNFSSEPGTVYNKIIHKVWYDTKNVLPKLPTAYATTGS